MHIIGYIFVNIVSLHLHKYYSSTYSQKMTTCHVKLNTYFIITINRATHRVTHGHDLMPIPYPRLIGLPIGLTHGWRWRPIPYPFGSGAHGSNCQVDPWLAMDQAWCGEHDQKRLDLHRCLIKRMIFLLQYFVEGLFLLTSKRDDLKGFIWIF